MRMPRPTHHRGSGRSHPIPTDWTVGPSSVVADAVATSGCTVRIGEPGGDPVWNPVSNQVETPDVPPVYAGPAEVYLVTDADMVRMVAGDEVSARVYGVKLPADAALTVTDPDGTLRRVDVGNVIRVTTDPDPELVGKTLTLKAIDRGTRRFSRLLLALLND